MGLYVDYDERIMVDVAPIVSNPTIKWSESKERKFNLVDNGAMPLTMRGKVWNKIIRMIPLNIRFEARQKVRNIQYWFEMLPKRAPKKIRGIGWRIHNFIEEVKDEIRRDKE